MAARTAERTQRRLAKYATAVALADSGQADETLAEAVRLLRDGLAPLHMVSALGISKTSLYEMLSDPTREHTRARKQRYHGTCRECGGRTSYGSSGETRICRRCLNHEVEEKLAQVVALWDAGLTAGEVADRLGLFSEREVSARVDYHRRQRGRAISLHRRRNREAWPVIAQLYKQGMTIRQIAVHLETSPENIRIQMRTMRERGGIDLDADSRPIAGNRSHPGTATDRESSTITAPSRAPGRRTSGTVQKKAATA